MPSSTSRPKRASTRPLPHQSTWPERRSELRSAGLALDSQTLSLGQTTRVVAAVEVARARVVLAQTSTLVVATSRAVAVVVTVLREAAEARLPPRRANHRVYVNDCHLPIVRPWLQDMQSRCQLILNLCFELHVILPATSDWRQRGKDKAVLVRLCFVADGSFCIAWFFTSSCLPSGLHLQSRAYPEQFERLVHFASCLCYNASNYEVSKSVAETLCWKGGGRVLI